MGGRDDTGVNVRHIECEEYVREHKGRKITGHHLEYLYSGSHDPLGHGPLGLVLPVADKRTGRSGRAGTAERVLIWLPIA
jgi:hypothetical protein